MAYWRVFISICVYPIVLMMHRMGTHTDVLHTLDEVDGNIIFLPETQQDRIMVRVQDATF